MLPVIQLYERNLLHRLIQSAESNQRTFTNWRLSETRRGLRKKTTVLHRISQARFISLPGVVHSTVLILREETHLGDNLLRQSHLLAYDKGDNEVKQEAVHGKSGFYLTAVEKKT